MNEFSINIINQNWISETNSEYDLCSHGNFELIIGNTYILDKKEDIEWTISTSTLNLLRCIESNHLASEKFEILLHCGELLMLSCPVGIYFDLTHKDDYVIIENIFKQPETSNDSIIKYRDLKIKISKEEFALQILKIAEKVIAFFEASPEKKFQSAEDKLLWDKFWAEFNKLYENAKNYYNS